MKVSTQSAETNSKCPKMSPNRLLIEAEIDTKTGTLTTTRGRFGDFLQNFGKHSVMHLAIFPHKISQEKLIRP